MAMYPSVPPGSIMSGAASGLGGGVGVAAPNAFYSKSEDDQLFDMIASRMRWNQTDPLVFGAVNPPPFRMISAHKLNPDTVVVFIIQNGKVVLIEDGISLFPSDTLVTQLRLLAEAK